MSFNLDEDSLSDTDDGFVLFKSQAKDKRVIKETAKKDQVNMVDYNKNLQLSDDYSLDNSAFAEALNSEVLNNEADLYLQHYDNNMIPDIFDDVDDAVDNSTTVSTTVSTAGPMQSKMMTISNEDFEGKVIVSWREGDDYKTFRLDADDYYITGSWPYSDDVEDVVISQTFNPASLLNFEVRRLDNNLLLSRRNGQTTDFYFNGETVVVKMTGDNKYSYYDLGGQFILSFAATDSTTHNYELGAGRALTITDMDANGYLVDLKLPRFQATLTGCDDSIQLLNEHHGDHNYDHDQSAAINELEAQLRLLRNDKLTQLAKIDKLTAEVKRLTVQDSDLYQQTRNNGYETEISGLTQTVMKLTDEVKVAEQQLSVSQQELASSQRELAATKQELELAAEARQQELVNIVLGVQQMKSRHDLEVDKLQQQLAELQQSSAVTISGLQAQLADAQACNLPVNSPETDSLQSREESL